MQPARQRALLLAVCAATAQAAYAVPAFPGAEGFGANSTGGRGGDVYHVTTLDADIDHLIPGSLSYGLYYKNVPAAGRTIVFDVGGTIDMSAGTITIKEAAKITLAGQTAPSPITLIGNTFMITGNTTSRPTNNIIMRYLSVRKGSGSGADAISIQGSGGTNNVILDHISGSWSEDEVISVTQSATNVTVQNSIISEALTDGHAYGSLIRPDKNSQVSLIGNLYSNQKSRNPRPGSYDGMTLDLEFQNNVVYNWSDRAGYIAGANSTVQPLNMNYVGNYLIAGPSTPGSPAEKRNTAFIKEVNSSPLALKFFQAGNKIDSTAGPTRDGVDTGWDMFKTLTSSNYTAFPDADKVATRFAYPDSTPDSADDAYAKVIASVGNTPWARSTTDERFVNDVLNYTGVAPVTAPPAAEWNAIVNTPMATRPAGWDTDLDGMPNWWENLRGTNPNTADNNGMLAGNGYTNLENYINSVTFTAKWNLNANGNWSSYMNWRGERPNSNYATVNFAPGITAPRTVTVDMPVSASDMNFDSAHAYTLAGSETITLDALSGSTTVNVVSGNHVVSAPVALADNLIVTANAAAGIRFTGQVQATGKTITKAGTGSIEFQKLQAAGLNILGGGVKIAAKPTANSPQGLSVLSGLSIGAGSLDLTNNSLIVEYSTLGTLLSDTRSALASGQITTSASGDGHALGYATAAAIGGASEIVGENALLIAYTYAGDANLDGSVNALDFAAVASNFGASGAVWTSGDFNYDGVVDSLDFNLLAGQFNKTMAASASAPGALVPEPALLSLFVVPALMAHRQRPARRLGQLR